MEWCCALKFALCVLGYKERTKEALHLAELSVKLVETTTSVDIGTALAYSKVVMSIEPSRKFLELTESVRLVHLRGPLLWPIPSLPDIQQRFRYDQSKSAEAIPVTSTFRHSKTRFLEATSLTPSRSNETFVHDFAIRTSQLQTSC